MLTSLTARLAMVGLVLVAFFGLWMHDRVQSAKLKAAQAQIVALQASNDSLTASLRAQNDAVAKLRSDGVVLQRQADRALQDAAAVRASSEDNKKRIAALQVPTQCSDALAFLVRYWRSAPAPQR